MLYGYSYYSLEIVYIAQVTMAPLLNVTGTLLRTAFSAVYSLVAAVSSLFGHVFSTLRDIFVQPMPSPSVMAVGSNVVGASSTLIKNITPVKDTTVVREKQKDVQG